MKIINVVGTRPNLIKMVSLVNELNKHRKIKHLLVHTGQHYDETLSGFFFDDLELPRPEINLNVGSESRRYRIKEIKNRFRLVLLKENPDLVVVVGDVDSTVACASVASKLGIKIAHIEAGLRSFDLSMPEERNRIKTDIISDYLFVTEKSAIKNLRREGVDKNKIFFVGNIMIDTLINNLKKAKKSKIVNMLGLKEKDFIVLTVHRPNNVDKKENLLRILSMLNYIQKKIKIILPLHPRTRKSIEKFELKGKIKKMKNLVIIKPAGYFDFLNLVLNSRFVLTDSGGIQEETTYLNIPCITIRSNTERPITITQGSNVLVGNDKNKLVLEFKKIMNSKFKGSTIPKYWDGKTAFRIVKILENKFKDYKRE